VHHLHSSRHLSLGAQLPSVLKEFLPHQVQVFLLPALAILFYCKVKVKSSLCLTKYHVMMTYWGSGGISPRILNPALDGGMWSASLPSRYTHGTHWIGGWVGPRAGLDATEKRKIPAPADNGTPAVQPVA